MLQIQPQGLFQSRGLRSEQDLALGFYQGTLDSCSIFEPVCFMFAVPSFRFSNLYSGAFREALYFLFAPRLKLCLFIASITSILLTITVLMIQISRLAKIYSSARHTFKGVCYNPIRSLPLLFNFIKNSSTIGCLYPPLLTVLSSPRLSVFSGNRKSQRSLLKETVEGCP